MSTFDIILDANSDFIEENGDFKVGDNDNNLIFYNVVAHKGHYRTSPTIGVGIDKYLNSAISESIIKADIKRNLKLDIFPNPDIDITEWPTIRINKVVIELA